MNKITMSKDGIPRITLKLETRLAARDMAVHLINSLRFGEGMSTWTSDDETLADRDLRIENAIKARLSEMSDKEILEKISDSILSYGTESAYYTVSDEGYDNAADFLTGYLIRKYKGFGQMGEKEEASDEGED